MDESAPITPPPPEDPEVARAKARAEAIRELRLWTRDLAIVSACAVFVVLFLFQPFKVEGTSMYPELDDEERILVNKLVYRISDIKRGDVVIFRFPRDTSKSFIKRVIGLPGETIEIRHGLTYVNDVQLPEPYVPDIYRSDESFGPTVVPKQSYYVMGDHRSTSNDSRAWGPVDVRYIYGRAVLKMWPLSKFGRIP
ncbi:MAG: signal peptidase I [Acidobacteriota bacterium]